MKKPQMIFFDYGGTLINETVFDFTKGEEEVFRHVVKNPLNVSFSEVSKFETDYYASLKEVRNLAFEPHEFQMLHYKYEYFGIELDISYEEAESILWEHTCPLNNDLVMPGVHEFLDYLQEQKIRTAVISNMGWSQKALIQRIKRIFPNHEFEFILASSEYGLRKPDSRIFSLALRKADLTPDDVWFIGDTFDTDILGALSIGMHGILYRGITENGPKRAENIPSYDQRFDIIDNYSELRKILNNLQKAREGTTV